MAAVASAAAPPRQSRRRLAPALSGLYGLLGLALAAYFLTLILSPGARELSLFNGWGAAAFEITVSALAILRAATTRGDRIAPLALGSGMLMWAVGDVVLTVESRHGANPASPSLADLFYLLFFPLAYLAIVRMVRRDALRLVPALWLDGAIAGLGGAAPC